MTETNILAALADELGDIEQELAPLKAKMNRAESLKLLLRTAHKDKPSQAAFTVAGTRWQVLLGPKGQESTVDVAKLYALAGLEKFLALASVPLKSLATLAPETVAAVIRTAQTGSRKLVVVPASAKFEPAAPAKARKRER